MKIPSAREVEIVVMEWIGVVTAIFVALISAIGMLWARWKTTMKELLSNHADSIKKNGKDQK